MKIPKTTPRNNTKSIRNRMYNDSTVLFCMPLGTNDVIKTIENKPTIKHMFNKNSMNFVSISYCDGIIKIEYSNIKTLLNNYKLSRGRIIWYCAGLENLCPQGLVGSNPTL